MSVEKKWEVIKNRLPAGPGTPPPVLALFWLSMNAPFRIAAYRRAAIRVALAGATEFTPDEAATLTLRVCYASGAAAGPTACRRPIS